MTSAQHAARAAAQLREAAQDVARVAARRSARAEREMTEPFTGQRLELTREWEGTYPARPCHVRDARHAVEGSDRNAASDETLLICSELTTNSVLHSRSKDDGKFVLRVTVHAEYIWIECEDAWRALARTAR